MTKTRRLSLKSLPGHEKVFSAISSVKELNISNWISIIGGMLCFAFSYGFTRAWPCYFKPTASYLSDTTNSTISELEISQTSKFMLLGISTGAASCGFIVPILKRKNTVLLSAGLGSLALVIFAYTLRFYNSFYMYGSIFMLGYGQGLSFLVAQNQIKKTVPTCAQGSSMTLVLLGNSFGDFCFPYLFNFTSENYGVVNSLYITAGVFLALSIASFSMQETEEETKMVLEKPKIFRPSLFKNPVYSWYMVSFCFGLGAFLGTLTMRIPYISWRFNLSKIEAIAVNGMYPIGEVFGRLSCFVVCFFTTKPKILFTSYIFMAGCWMAAWFSPTANIMKIVYFITGIANGFMGGVLFAIIGDCVEKASDHI